MRARVWWIAFVYAYDGEYTSVCQHCPCRCSLSTMQIYNGLAGFSCLRYKLMLNTRIFFIHFKQGRKSRSKGVKTPARGQCHDGGAAASERPFGGLLEALCRDDSMGKKKGGERCPAKLIA